MALVSLVDILGKAKKAGYGVGMFDVMNSDMVQAIITAAELERSPVILAFAEVHKMYQSLPQFSQLLIRAAESASVPVCVHCDHGVSYDFLIQCIMNGFTSIMFDGSTLPYEDNVAQTAEIVKAAHAVGCSVEGELGRIGGIEGGGCDDRNVAYTDPELVADYVRRTGVDALAVAIGTVHGVYKDKPRLDLRLLSTINSISKAYLVLHGGSGLSSEDFKNCIKCGITKVNIWTDLITAASCYVAGKYSTGIPPVFPFPDFWRGIMDAICMEARSKIRLFGSSGNA